MFACLICSESHTLEHCTKFKGLNLQGTLSEGRKLEICFNCLCKKHASTVCKFKSNCPITSCDKKHLGLLHFSKEEEPYKNSKQAPRKPTNGDHTSSKKPDPVIQQKETEASDSAEAGSQASYHISLSTNCICLGTLPVVVKAKRFDTGIKVYALLDDGSTEVAFKKLLLVEGTQADLEITTIIGKSKEAFYAQEFVVEVIDRSDSMECLGFS